MTRPLANRQTVVHCISSLQFGGVNTSMLAHLHALEAGAFNHVVCSVTASTPLLNRYHALGVRVVILGHRGRRDIARTLWRLRALLAEPDIAILHSHLILAQSLGGLAANASRIPHVTTIHRDDAGAPDRARWLRTRVTDRYVAVSESVRRATIEAFDVPGSIVDTIYNGLPITSPVELSGSESRAKRKELGASADGPILLNVGRLVPQKNQAVLLRAMSQIVKTFPNATLFIAGGGELHDDLLREVRQLRLDEHVRMLGRRNDMQEVFAVADVVVQPSTSEGFSIAILEAMASGTPIVASTIEPMREALRPNADALLVEVDGPDEIVKAVTQLLSDKAAAARLAESAAIRVRNEFSADATARHLDRVYASMLRR